MENSALNLAHQESRRAESHLRARRFEEAVECHKKAANLLSEAMGCTQQARAIESLTLQQQHHLRQTDIIKLKKQQYVKYCQALENQKSKMSADGSCLSIDMPANNLQVAIFRTMEQADSLMDQLLQRNEDDTLIDEVDTPVTPPVVKGSKQPKDDKMVVEELRTLTQHLHNFVIQLITQLDASNKENEELKNQIRILTSQLETSPTSSSTQPAVASTSSMTTVPQLISDSTTSPYVFSPCTELSPDVTPTTSIPSRSIVTTDRTLPILAPLEMPQFDFSVFQKLEEQPSEGSSQ